MTDKPHRITDSLGSTIDAEIADLLDRYLTDRQRGVAIDRDQWLRQHPQHAERLSQCLDAAELFGGAESGGFDLAPETRMPGSIGDYEIRGEPGRIKRVTTVASTLRTPENRPFSIVANTFSKTIPC